MVEDFAEEEQVADEGEAGDPVARNASTKRTKRWGAVGRGVGLSPAHSSNRKNTTAVPESTRRWGKVSTQREITLSQLLDSPTDLVAKTRPPAAPKAPQDASSPSAAKHKKKAANASGWVSRETNSGGWHDKNSVKKSIAKGKKGTQTPTLPAKRQKTLSQRAFEKHLPVGRPAP